MLRSTASRAIITPQSFAVAPELLGAPLAGSWRRLVAMVLDLIVLGIVLAIVERPGILFALVLAGVVLRATTGSGEGRVATRWAKRALRIAAAVILFWVVVRSWNFGESVVTASQRVEQAEEERPAEAGNDFEFDFSQLGLSGRRSLFFGADVLQLAGAESDEEAERFANKAVDRLAEGEPDSVVIGRIKGALGDGRLRIGDARSTTALLAALDRRFPAIDAIHDSAAIAADSAAGAVARDSTEYSDTAAVAYAQALRAGDTSALALLEPRAVEELAGDSLARLTRDNARLERELEEAEEDHGPVAAVLNTFDDLGIGLGWSALYFTAFLALWRGQTPGKRIVGIRVIRLNGRPISWWIAFERFGGYTASVVTGLLGFAQILWDRNRQALHDKVAETVVVRNLPGLSRTARVGTAAAQPRPASPVGGRAPGSAPGE